MQIGKVSRNDSSGTSYKSVIIKNGKQQWSFMQASGKYNYVSVRKDHANPFRNLLGNEYDSWDNAQEKYKSPSVKTMILMAELALKA